MTQPIWYDSTEAGAPTLNNVAGSLLEVLRSCLVNGFNAKTVTSIAVASGVATVTCAAHGFIDTYGKLVLISGSTEPLLNGNKQPGNVLTNSFTYPAPGVADGTYTGTISAKRAPLGWTEPHTGTNESMFARSAPEATAMLLRVNDRHANGSTATDARAIMVESATGIDAFSGVSPADSSLAGGLYWYKGASSTVGKQWAIVGDDRAIWLLLPGSNSSLFMPHVFGDIYSYKSVDAFAAIITGGTSTGPGSTPIVLTGSPLGTGRVSYGSVFARGSSQTGASVRATQHGFSILATTFGAAGPIAPSPVESGFVLSRPILVSDDDSSAGYPFRGAMPGMAQPLCITKFGTLQIFDGFVGDDRKYIAVQTGGSGQIFIDISGPWR